MRGLAVSYGGIAIGSLTTPLEIFVLSIPIEAYARMILRMKKMSDTRA